MSELQVFGCWVNIDDISQSKIYIWSSNKEKVKLFEPEIYIWGNEYIDGTDNFKKCIKAYGSN